MRRRSAAQETRPDEAKTAQVVDLSGVRARLRITAYQGRVDRALEGNEQALRSLYTAGLVFQRAGTQVARDLLLARQHLLTVASLIRRLADEGEVPAPRLPQQIEAVYEEVNLLLERSANLVERCAPFLR